MLTSMRAWFDTLSVPSTMDTGRSFVILTPFFPLRQTLVALFVQSCRSLTLISVRTPPKFRMHQPHSSLVTAVEITI